MRRFSDRESEVILWELFLEEHKERQKDSCALWAEKFVFSREEEKIMVTFSQPFP